MKRKLKIKPHWKGVGNLLVILVGICAASYVLVQCGKQLVAKPELLHEAVAPLTTTDDT